MNTTKIKIKRTRLKVSTKEGREIKEHFLKTKSVDACLAKFASRYDRRVILLTVAAVDYVHGTA